MRLAAILWATLLIAETPYRGLPPGATIIETRDLRASAHPNRAPVLWMLHPKKYDRGSLTRNNVYTCPEVTLGSHFYGPTRVSLADTQEKTILNTVEIQDPYSNRDIYWIPYRIQAGGYCHVAGRQVAGEGWPQLLYLLDYNGDGQALEAAFFSALACTGLATTLVGYSPRQDRVIRYRTELESRQGRKIKHESLEWVDYLFSKRPVRPGFWKYEIDYRGRCGALSQYEIRYDRDAEQFVGKITMTVTTNPNCPP